MENRHEVCETFGKEFDVEERPDKSLVAIPVLTLERKVSKVKKDTEWYHNYITSPDFVNAYNRLSEKYPKYLKWESLARRLWGKSYELKECGVCMDYHINPKEPEGMDKIKLLAKQKPYNNSPYLKGIRRMIWMEYSEWLEAKKKGIKSSKKYIAGWKYHNKPKKIVIYFPPFSTIHPSQKYKDEKSMILKENSGKWNFQGYIYL